MTIDMTNPWHRFIAETFRLQMEFSRSIEEVFDTRPSAIRCRRMYRRQTETLEAIQWRIRP